MQHGPMCPWIKALEFDATTGQIITRVEFLTPADMQAPAKQEPPPADYPRMPAKGERP